MYMYGSTACPSLLVAGSKAIYCYHAIRPLDSGRVLVCFYARLIRMVGRQSEVMVGGGMLYMRVMSRSVLLLLLATTSV